MVIAVSTALLFGLCLFMSILTLVGSKSSLESAAVERSQSVHDVSLHSVAAGDTAKTDASSEQEVSLNAEQPPSVHNIQSDKRVSAFFCCFAGILIAIASAFFIAASNARNSQDSKPAALWSDDHYMPSIDDLPVGNWTEMVPASADTVCARGTPFAFFVKRGSSNNMILEFEGGGACWSKSTCEMSGATFKDTADNSRSFMRRVQLGKQRISGLADSKGPYADWTHVYVPYCTGDLHWGDADVQYSKNLRIRHNGYKNALSAVQWAVK